MSEPVLEIEPDRERALHGARTVLGLAMLMTTAILAIAIFAEVAPAGLLTWLFGLVLFGWMFGYLYSFGWRLWRLSRLRGPVLTITPLGFTDYWSGTEKFVAWDDVSYSDWEERTVTLVLRIFPKHEKPWSFIRGWFGAQEFHYQSQYLATPAHEIASFVLDHVPAEKLR